MPGRGKGMEVELDELPPCDICGEAGEVVTATHDGKTTVGPWAFMCDMHFERYGVGVGLGKGQKLVLRARAES